MEIRRRRPGGAAARSRTFTLTLALTALVGTAGCGTSTPNPAASGGVASSPASAASVAPSAVAAQPSAATAAFASADWTGFKGNPGRSAFGLEGPAGHEVLNWRYQASGGVPNNIVIVGDGVWFASDDAMVHSLDRLGGGERWSVKIANGPLVGPAAADGRLYFLNAKGEVFALDAATGKTLWTSSTTYDSPSQPTSDDGTIVFGTGDGFLVAVAGATGEEQWKVKVAPEQASVHSPAVADGMVYAGTGGGRFVAVDARTHTVAWTADLQGADTGTATVANGLAFIGAGADAMSGTLHAFDAKTGQPRWTAPAPLLQTPAVAGSLVFSSTANGLVQAMDAATGTSRWSIQVTGDVRPMATAGDVLYLSADNEQRVYAVEAATGNRLWQLDVDGRSDCCIAVAHGAVSVGTLTGSVYSIGGDGQQIAAVPFDAPAPSVAPSQAPAISAIAAKPTWTADLRGMGFHPVCQIAVDADGRTWAPEAEGNKIAIFDRSGKLLEERGGAGTGPGQFDFTRPNDDGYGTLAFAKDGSFFVLDVGNRRVQHFDAKGHLVGGWGTFGTEPGQFTDPIGIVVARDGSVWVLDDQRNVVEHYDARGKVLGSFDPFADEPNNDGANSLAIDSAGNLYVSMVAPSHVAVFSAGGKRLRVIGDGVFTEQAGTMAIDAAGRLFVTQGPDRGSAPGVLVFAADGGLLGGFAPIGDGDGQLVFPGGIALDGHGGIVVQDSLPESARLVRFALPDGLK